MREFCEASVSTRGLLQEYGGVDLLRQVLLHPDPDVYLQQETVRLLYCLDGCNCLLHVTHYSSLVCPKVVSQILWTLREHACQHGAVLNVALSVIPLFKDDTSVCEACLETFFPVKAVT